jgi:hypothetical protein
VSAKSNIPAESSSGGEERVERGLDFSNSSCIRRPANCETLRAGQIIIADSITPPIWVAPGETMGFHLQPLEPISLIFT